MAENKLPMRCSRCLNTVDIRQIQERMDCSAGGVCALGVVDGVIVTHGQQAFDDHWELHNDMHPAPSKLAAAKEFLRPLVPYLGQLDSSRVLDSGSGNGVHARVWDQFSLRGGIPTTACLDISFVALRQIQNDRIPGAIAIQGDMLDLPFPDQTFDASFSFGSLMYTDNPRRALLEMVRVTKAGGWIGLWVYPPPAGMAGKAFLGVRKLCGLLGTRFTRSMAHLLVPFLGMLPTRSGVSLRNASWRQCLEVVLVNLAPVQISFESESVVCTWLRNAGVEIITRDENSPITVWGRKYSESSNS